MPVIPDRKGSPECVINQQNPSEELSRSHGEQHTDINSGVNGRCGPSWSPAAQNNNRRLLNVGSMSGASGLRWYSYCDGLGGMIPWFGDVESDEEMKRYDHAAQAGKYADENTYHKTNVDIALIPFWSNLCEVRQELFFLGKRLMQRQGGIQIMKSWATKDYSWKLFRCPFGLSVAAITRLH